MPLAKEIREQNAQCLADVLLWLRQKGVQRILKLVVRDNQSLQCQDETIEKALRDWDIRYLDWNKLDMSIDIIQRGGAKNLVELCLTSSGSNTALIGWTDPKYGLVTLTEVRADNPECVANFEATRLRTNGLDGHSS